MAGYIAGCHPQHPVNLGSYICKGTASPGDLLVPLSLEVFQVLNVCLSVCCHVFTPLSWLYLFIIRASEIFFGVFNVLNAYKKDLDI